MKIAIITLIINKKSGARAPVEIAKALSKQGNEVVIIGSSNAIENEAVDELKKDKVEVKTINTSISLLIPFKVSQVLRNGNFDIASFHSTLPYFLGTKLSGLPTVRTYYGSQLDAVLDKSFPGKPSFWIKSLNSLANFYIKFVEKFILLNSQAIVGISKYTKNELKRLYTVKTDYVYLGSAPKSFTVRARNLKSKSNKSEEVTILSVSRVVPYKGFHKLIRVFNRLSKNYPNLKLTIIGSSPSPTYLKYLKKQIKSNTKILTNISDKELSQAYAKADIYASFDRYMFFGMPILEAATFSVPTVAIAKCAAVETIIHGKSGFLAKDEVEFENYLEILIKNKNKRTRMGKKAFIRAAEDFSWDKTGTEYSKFFRKIL